MESVLLAGDELTRDAVAEVVERLAARGREELGEQGGELRATYELRYAGQAFELPSRATSPTRPQLRARFRRAPTRSATATRIRRPSSSW